MISKTKTRFFLILIYTVLSIVFYSTIGAGATGWSGINVFRHLAVFASSVLIAILFGKEILKNRIAHSLLLLVMPLEQKTAGIIMLTLSLCSLSVTSVFVTSFHPLSLSLVVMAFLAIGCISVKLAYSAETIPRLLALITLIIGTVLSIISYAGIYTKLGLIDGENKVHDFATCMYFSIVTWTTLGYGDVRPSETARAFAASEALLGYIFMGILVGVIIQEAQSRPSS